MDFNVIIQYEACCLDEGSEVIFHSGCTQEFYSYQLDSESLLTFNFGVKSLYRLAVEYEEKYLDDNEDNVLPKVIKDVLKSRRTALTINPFIPRPKVNSERIFSKSELHAGLWNGFTYVFKNDFVYFKHSMSVYCYYNT